MIFTVCACGANGGKSNATGSKQGEAGPDKNYATTIYVCGTWGNFEALEAAAQLFNKEYPNIQVVYEQLGNFGSDLKNRFVSGENIDIYFFDWMLTNDERYAYYWENAEDLSGKLDFGTIPAEYLETGMVNGKQYLVPIYEHSYGMMVNEDLLKAHDLKVPGTYGEFIECCERLKADGIYPVLVADSDYLTQIYFDHIYRTVIQSGNAKALAGEIVSGNDSAGFVENTLKLMDEFNKADYVHPDSMGLEDNYNSAILRFFEGDIAFVPFITASFSGTKKREAKSEAFTANPFTYSFVPSMCTNGYENSVQQLGTVYMGVFKGIADEKKPYVTEFLQFLMNDEGSEALATVKNMPTANKNVGNKSFPYLESLKKDERVYIGMRQDGDYMLKLNQLLRTASTLYSEGITADELLKEAVEKVKEK
ncbi:MAG: ABC transporter substrate-binding protein [Eubacteriales bacterium]|nr:ABC transporter substrate-binding protein [Eubacteriales bacterium]